MKRSNLIRCGLAMLTAAAALLGATGTVHAQAKKPNILVIMTDDVGVWNISAYHRGMSTSVLQRSGQSKWADRVIGMKNNCKHIFTFDK
jgi:hypothetical protein